jgi:uncharacterized RDD family membrane protein YckC
MQNVAEGVYYSHESYAGFWRRLLIEAIDLSIILTVFIVVIWLATDIFPITEKLVTIMLLLMAIVSFGYFVLLKRSSFGTLGYKICKVKIVNLKGKQPSLVSLTLRLMFGLIGPLNVLFDLIWLTGDSNRQALRDKMAKTYVIKKDAVPIGTGKLTYKNYGVFGYNVIFCEVSNPQKQS